jgi:pimeloyl-ACP methyl ester carboxylesterase
VDDFAGSAEASIERCYAGTTVNAEIVNQTRATLLANDPASFIACYRVFATADAEIAQDLHRISLPALAVTGDRDPGSTPAMARRLADAMPECRTLVIPDTRHMLPVQRPRELVAALTAFIGEHAHA